MKRNRKTVSFVLFAALLLSIIVFPAFVRGNKAIAESTTTTGSTGASPIDSAEFVIGMNQYFVNNQAPGISMDAAPYIDSGRTLVPVRYLADALGATTNWDSDTQQVTVSTAAYNISMSIGSTTLTVNGQAQTMDVAPLINDGRTYLPARWVAEALGFSVDWDATNKIAVIYPTSNIGEPAYNFVIEQAQQNAAKPEQVQKLESALGITMVGGSPGWYYDPTLNPDGSTNISWESQNTNNSFVTASYGPGDSNTASEVDVTIECVGQDSSTVSMDISPLQKVLEAFFPGQDADIQQAMTLAQQEASHAQAHYGCNPIPASRMTINGMTVAIGQGDVRSFARLEILGS